MKNSMKHTARSIAMRNSRAYDQDVVFLPALTPLEAAMIPAREEGRAYGALSLARRAFAFETEDEARQRQKIWVR